MIARLESILKASAQSRTLGHSQCTLGERHFKLELLSAIADSDFSADRDATRCDSGGAQRCAALVFHALQQTANQF